MKTKTLMITQSMAVLETTPNIRNTKELFNELKTNK